MGSINDVIDVLRQAPTNVDRGTLFEKLMVRYFQLDPALTQQYDTVWRWIDWPDRKGKPDTGIDLVARDRDTGEYTAIQCKFYEPTHTLSKGDIDSFFTASGKKPFTNRVIISTTDKWGKNAEDALDDQTTPVQRINMADIGESPIDWDIAWPQGNLTIDLAPAEKRHPRPHQVEAIDTVLKGFAVGNDRGKLIMACGTGKTFTALKLAERICVPTATAAPASCSSSRRSHCRVSRCGSGPLYRAAVDSQLTKDDIFYYAYAILHDPDYRTRYAAALRVRDIDFLRRRISLHTNAVKVGTGFAVGTLKSGRNRVVVVPGFVTDALAHTARGKNRDDLMWPSTSGGYLRPPSGAESWLGGAVTRCQKKDKMFPRVTAHDLRHTAASLAISAGANVKVVQRMLGHASAAMTLDVYADLFDSDLDTVAESVAEMWPRQAKSV